MCRSRRAASKGVNAPPQRALSHMIPCARTRSGAGSHVVKALVRFGNAPDSPMPNSICVIAREVKFHVAPMNAVKNDHQITMRINTLRGPIQSPRNPLGISNSAYTPMKAEKMNPICWSLRERSCCTSGAANDRQTRSRYVMTAKVTANTITQCLARVGRPAEVLETCVAIGYRITSLSGHKSKSPARRARASHTPGPDPVTVDQGACAHRRQRGKRCQRLPDYAVNHHAGSHQNVRCRNRRPAELDGAQLLPIRAPAAEEEQRDHRQYRKERETETDVHQQSRKRCDRHHHGADALAQNRIHRRVPARVYFGRAS